MRHRHTIHNYRLPFYLYSDSTGALFFILYDISPMLSALASINVVNRHWARLLLGWLTVWVCNQPSNDLGRLSLLPCAGR